jgi:hypothetical protein
MFGYLRVRNTSLLVQRTDFVHLQVVSSCQKQQYKTWSNSLGETTASIAAAVSKDSGQAKGLASQMASHDSSMQELLDQQVKVSSVVNTWPNRHKFVLLTSTLW